VIGLYFGGQWFVTKFGNQFGNIELDAALDEAHDWTAEATSNPVEEGAPVTDHIIDQADKLRIRGFVTDTPLVASESVDGVVNNGDISNRTQGVFELLRELLKAREVMTVYTKHRVYDNMALTAVNIPRAAGVGEALEFTLDFVNIRKVATQLVDVPAGISAKKSAKGDGATANKAEPRKDAGKKQTEVKKPTSVLSRVIGSFR
jgi:hypothetical protein